MHNPDERLPTEIADQLWVRLESILCYFGVTVEKIHEAKNSCGVITHLDHGKENSSKNNTANSARAEALKMTGDEFYMQKAFNKAIEAYTTAIALSGLSPVQRAALYATRSAAYLDKGGAGGSFSCESDRKFALEDAKEAMRLSTTSCESHFRAGNAYHALGKYEKAVRAFDRALGLVPGHEEIRHARNESRRKLAFCATKQHLDPRHIKTFNVLHETRKFWQEKLGRPITGKLAKKKMDMAAKRIPGQADVYKAHDYHSGTGDVEQNYEMAAQYFAKAAGDGNAEAMYNLSIMYELGQGVKQDFDMSISLLRQAAAQPPYREYMGKRECVGGVAEAEHGLGVAYFHGVGVPQDFQEARKWYERAFEHGYSDAALNLGNLHRDGQGGPIDVEKAGEYYQAASNQGNPHAMEALAEHYARVEYDPIQAKYWYDRAVAVGGNLHAKFNKDNFYTILAQLTKEVKRVERNVAAWEASQGLQAHGMTLKERRQRAEKGMPPKEVVEALEEMKQLCLTPRPVTGPARVFDCDMLRECAAQGSVTAHKLLEALQHFDVVCQLISSGLSNDTWVQFYTHLAHTCRLDCSVIQLPPNLIPHMSDLLYDAMKTVPPDAPMSNSERDIRLCYVVLNATDRSARLGFVEVSRQKYPEEKLFHQRTADLQLALGDYKSALKTAKHACDLFPGDADCLFTLATISARMPRDEIPLTQAIQAFEEFLRVAPADHCQVPLAYYHMGILCTTPSLLEKIQSEENTTRNNGSKYYEMGLVAEKHQLPCYLPYDCIEKPILEKALQLKSLQEIYPTMATLMNPDRVAIIRAHRHHVKETRDGLHVCETRSLSEGDKGRQVVDCRLQLIGLKSITFCELEMTKEGVHEKCVVTVTVIEDPIVVSTPPFIRLLLQDENLNVCCAYIYNFWETDQKLVSRKLGHGARLSIVSPHVQTTQDGCHSVHVHDLNTLVLHSDADPSTCRLCARRGAKFSCCRCGRAFYCGRECQKVDWKEFKHKLVCIP